MAGDIDPRSSLDSLDLSWVLPDDFYEVPVPLLAISLKFAVHASHPNSIVLNITTEVENVKSLPVRRALGFDTDQW